MTIKKNIAAVLALVALSMNAVAPVLASETTLEISGNGASSDNTVNVSVEQNTVVSQKNEANIVNHIDADSDSGGNSANYNTGGSVNVDTGNAKTLVGVSTTANSNVADVENCGSCDQGADVLISGNGANSDNYAKLGLSSETVVAQGNYSDVSNHVDADAKTGYNDADRNTGGSVEVSTGSAFTHVDIENMLNSNSAMVGGGAGSNASDVSLRILGNGAYSDNDIFLALDRDVLLQQYNSADVDNWVDADSKTGGNDADRNTGGEVSIETGAAHTGVAVDNAINFNHADVDCDCLTGVMAKVSGNGYMTDNTIKAKLADDLNVFQENTCGYGYGWFDYDWFSGDCIDNHIDADSYTGVNDAGYNTGTPDSDPSISTGMSETVVGVENSGNSNVYGASPVVDLPLPGGNGINLNITFNLSQLLAALGLVS